jgi:hypothetical protein
VVETGPQQPDNSHPPRGPERPSAARGYGLEPAPWERMLHETPKAYAAFRVFRDQGVQRSYAETARALGKHESQIRRWAGLFRWKERAHAWDLAQSREVELLLQHEREQEARRRLRHAEQIERMAMAGIVQLVSRDPETGEPRLSPQLTPPLLVRFYELALKISNALPSPRAPDAPSADTADPLPALSDPELQQIIALAKERAQIEEPQEEHKDEQQTNTDAAEADPH